MDGALLCLLIVRGILGGSGGLPTVLLRITEVVLKVAAINGQAIWVFVLTWRGEGGYWYEERQHKANF